MSVKSLEELGEVRPRVMGAWGGLRMVLHGEYGELPVPDTFHRAIIEVKVCHLK